MAASDRTRAAPTDESPGFRGTPSGSCRPNLTVRVRVDKCIPRDMREPASRWRDFVHFGGGRPPPRYDFRRAPQGSRPRVYYFIMATTGSLPSKSSLLTPPCGVSTLDFTTSSWQLRGRYPQSHHFSPLPAGSPPSISLLHHGNYGVATFKVITSHPYLRGLHPRFHYFIMATTGSPPSKSSLLTPTYGVSTLDFTTSSWQLRGLRLQSHHFSPRSRWSPPQLCSRRQRRPHRPSTHQSSSSSR